MNQRKEVEELARKKGVVLAPPSCPVLPGAGPAGPAAGAGQGVAPPEPAPVKSKGFLARVMPAAADLMADMRAQLGPYYKGALDNLKNGRGYLVDEAARLAIGTVPADQYEAGQGQERQGWMVRRVRRKG